MPAGSSPGARGFTITGVLVAKSPGTIADSPSPRRIDTVMSTRRRTPTSPTLIRLPLHVAIGAHTEVIRDGASAVVTSKTLGVRPWAVARIRHDTGMGECRRVAGVRPVIASCVWLGRGLSRALMIRWSRGRYRWSAGVTPALASSWRIGTIRASRTFASCAGASRARA